MEEYHPDRRALEQFAGGGVLADEGRRIEEHLRTGCAVCQLAVDELLPHLEESAHLPLAVGPGPKASQFAEAAETAETAETLESAAWDQLFSKLERRLALIACEKDAAPYLVAELMRRPAPERVELVRCGPRYRTLAVCDLLIERSFETGFHDPAAAAELAGLGIAVAELIDGDYYGHAVVHDLQARAWAYLGNARRIGSDLVGAEQALACAEMLAEEGSADPLEEARLLDLRASLLNDQGWFEEAAELLDSVIEIYDDVQDSHRKGRALISKGGCLGNAGWSQRAIELISAGLPLLDERLEPRLVRAARHNLVWNLNESGQSEKARLQLERLRRCYDDLDEAWIELPLAWLEARITARSGDPQEAERRLVEVRRRFLERGRAYDASLVMLDLALLLLEQGRRAEVRQLPEQMLPILLSREVHPHALSALIAFQQAAEADELTPALIQQITVYLRRARKNPRLTFQQAA